MSEEFLGGAVRLFNGDSRDVLKLLPDNSVDSVVTDPPYALVSIVKRFGAPNAAPARDGDVYARSSAGFMGQKWDTGETAFAVEFWAEVMRVLKPGGHVIAFAGTRTYHRLACAVEDAGFEIRDMVQWLYGSGFPKSHDVSKGIDAALGVEREIVSERPAFGIGGKGCLGGHAEGATMKIDAGPATSEAEQWQGWGTALKPACEPCVLARKPLSGTVARNVLAHGTGALNIDACRIEAEKPTGWGGKAGGTREVVCTPGNKDGDPRPVEGRWPANVVHDGSAEVVDLFGESVRYFGTFSELEKICASSNANSVEEISALLSELVGSALSHAATKSTLASVLNLRDCRVHFTNATPNELRLIAATTITAILNIANGFLLGLPRERLFQRTSLASYVVDHAPTGITTITISLSKSSGYAEVATFNITLPNTDLGAADSESVIRGFYSAKADAMDRVGAKHPTVKPVDLMQWMVRLITPPGGTVLDPFAGTGTAGEAAFREGFKAILVEREATYCEDIRARMAMADGGEKSRRRAIAKRKGGGDGLGSPGALFE